GRSAVRLDDGVEDPLVVLLAVGEISRQRRVALERTDENIGPDAVVSAHCLDQARAVPVGAEPLDRAEAAGQRHCAGKLGRRRIDRRSDRLRSIHDHLARSSPKNLFNSALPMRSAKPSHLPSLAICVAVLMKACMATRASEPPTLIRRTPIAARSLTVKPNAPLFRKLIALPPTAFTVASICSRLLMPGEYRQSAPASANAFSRRMVSSMSGRPRMKPSVRAVNTTSPPALSMAARAAFTRASAASKS